MLNPRANSQRLHHVRRENPKPRENEGKTNPDVIKRSGDGEGMTGVDRVGWGGEVVGTSPPGNGAEHRTGKCVCCRHRDAPWREKTRSLTH